MRKSRKIDSSGNHLQLCRPSRAMVPLRLGGAILPFYNGGYSGGSIRIEENNDQIAVLILLNLGYSTSTSGNGGALSITEHEIPNAYPCGKINNLLLYHIGIHHHIDEEDACVKRYTNAATFALMRDFVGACSEQTDKWPTTRIRTYEKGIFHQLCNRRVVPRMRRKRSLKSKYSKVVMPKYVLYS